MNVALLSAQSALGHDIDEPAVVEAFLGLGAEISVQCWDRPTDWSRFDAAVLKSTWDYSRRLDEFTQWLDDVSEQTRLVNPFEVVSWNLDKRYLHELESDGVEIVPTTFARSLEELVFPAGEYVIKPSCSAGAQNTAMFTEGQHDQAVALSTSILRSGKSVMVQPYLSSVNEVGETGMYFFGGEFSHAFRKGLQLDAPRSTDQELFVVEDIAERTANPDQLALAARVMESLTHRFGDSVVYARIDVLEGECGPQLLECELIEPSLFVHTSPGSAQRYAAAVLTALGESC